MPCYAPWIANQGAGMTRPLSCGQCIGCRLRRSVETATRCVHEAKMHEHNCSITLTYNDEHLPVHNNLVHKDWQVFIRALRKHFKKKIRYYMAGEYGTHNGRPHFHAGLFGVDMPDKKYYKTTKAKTKIYTSEILTKIWGKGFVSVGDVNFESMAYIARYIVAKVTGPKAESHYTELDPDTGEFYSRKPEYNRMSLKPGLGLTWYEKFKDDVYPEGRVHIRGNKEIQAPRYYDKKFEIENPQAYKKMKDNRNKEASKHKNETSPQRLTARETVHKAQANQLKRTI